MGPEDGPLASLTGSELWAPVLKVFIMLVEWVYEDSELGAHIRGHGIHISRSIISIYQGP